MQLHESTVRQDARTPRRQDEGWFGHGRRGDVLVAPEQECNRPQTQRRRKRRRENANEIPLTPLYHILSPGPHRANTLQICNELGGFPNDGALARRPASRQQKGVVSRSEPVGSAPPAPRRCPAAYPQKPMRTRVRSRCLNTEWSFLWKNKRKSCRSEKRIFRLGS